jgi:alanine racemase
VKEIKAGTTVGYGARFRAEKDMKIATVGMGYGDGYPRTAIDGTPVLVQDKICKIAGRVSMDMITLDVTGHENIACGNLVTFWGEKLNLATVAGFTQNSSYDILTSVQLRVKFNWTNQLS